MEKLFVETKYSGKIELPKDLINELPVRVMVATTVQFVDQLREIKEKLKAYGKDVYFFKSVHGKHEGQILGCDTFLVKAPVEGFLYIGDGEFHPRALLVNEKPVFYYNPFSEKWGTFGRKDWEEVKLKKKVGLIKFHSAQKIGVLVSAKEGQRLMQGSVERLKEKLENEGKSVHLFLGNEINEMALADFNFIEAWVNTACPRIIGDIKGMVNLRDVLD